MIHFTDTFSTPFGLFSIAVDADGAVAATAFGAEAALRQRFRCETLRADRHATAAAREQVLAYCAGERAVFALSLSPPGTAFQRSVWSVLQRIPLGETRTYGQVAAELGNPNAPRAVGRANATNPICLIVPCHRVIGAGGSLTGFAFGEPLKRRLLEHEQGFAGAPKAHPIPACASGPGSEWQGNRAESPTQGASLQPAALSPAIFLGRSPRLVIAPRP